MSGIERGEVYVEEGRWMLTVGENDWALIDFDRCGESLLFKVTHADLDDLRRALDNVLDPAPPSPVGDTAGESR